MLILYVLLYIVAATVIGFIYGYVVYAATELLYSAQMILLAVVAAPLLISRRFREWLNNLPEPSDPAQDKPHRLIVMLFIPLRLVFAVVLTVLILLTTRFFIEQSGGPEWLFKALSMLWALTGFSEFQGYSGVFGAYCVLALVLFYLGLGEMGLGIAFLIVLVFGGSYYMIDAERISKRMHEEFYRDPAER